MLTESHHWMAFTGIMTRCARSKAVPALASIASKATGSGVAAADPQGRDGLATAFGLSSHLL
jgi:hypothetical protein